MKRKKQLEGINRREFLQKSAMFATGTIKEELWQFQGHRKNHICLKT